MIKDLLEPKDIFRTVRWTGICLFSAVCVTASFLVIAEGESPKGFSTAHDLQLDVQLSISHRIKVKDLSSGPLVLSPEGDETSTGSRDYCVASNNQNQLKARVEVVPVGRADYKLSAGQGKDVEFQAFVIDLKKGGQKAPVGIGKKIPLTASNDPGCSNPTTQLFVSANTSGIEIGNYSARLQLRFAAD